jgi:putative endonuclease
MGPKRKAAPSHVQHTSKRRRRAEQKSESESESESCSEEDLQGEEEEANEGENCWVYVLESISNPNNSYVGYTVNRQRRIRQHNGELVGGAKYTSSRGPWRMVMAIRGNGLWWTRKAALSLEWRLKHVARGRFRNRRRPKGLSRWVHLHLPGQHPAAARRLNDLCWLLHNRQKWTQNSPQYARGQKLTVEMHPSLITPKIKEFLAKCQYWEPSLVPLQL